MFIVIEVEILDEKILALKLNPTWKWVSYDGASDH